MEIKIKRITFFSIVFLLLFTAVLLSHFFLDRNLYRNLLSNLTWYIGYPSFIVSVTLSLIGLRKINLIDIKSKNIYIVLNLLSIITFFLFIIRIVWVNMVD